MARLDTKIKLYCEANSKTVDFSPSGNVRLEEDGSNHYIKIWNNAK